MTNTQIRYAIMAMSSLLVAIVVWATFVEAPDPMGIVLGLTCVGVLGYLWGADD